MVSVDDRRLVFLALALPFVLNDFVFIALNGSYAIYPIDYAVRIAVLLACFYWPLARQACSEAPVSEVAFPRAALVVLVLPTVCWLFFIFVVSPMAAKLGAQPRFTFHHINAPALLVLDLSVGLFLVALSEELIFRKLCCGWLRALGLRTSYIVVWSACFFAATHWAGGFASLLNTFFMGVVYMAAYIGIGRIWPLVLAHWVHNFIYLGLY